MNSSLNKMKIYELLNKNTVKANVKAESKEDLLNFVVDLLSSDIPSEQLVRVRAAVKERESIMSTGVGKGLAIPHAKIPELTKNFAAFVQLAEGVDYDSIDRQPVKMVFLMVGPSNQNSEHIKLLSRISRLMNNDDFREKLLSCKNELELIATFEAEENKLFSA